jgi:putative integral membrane protein (TIGR02587 family)
MSMAAEKGTRREAWRRPWKSELDDMARAVSGAFLFGTPLLFTMEMWWIGTYTEMWRLLLFLALALAVNTMLAVMSGFKEGNTWDDAVQQAFEAVALGAVASSVVLLVLGRISTGDPFDSTLGKIVLQTIPLSIGASAANAFLNRGQDSQQEGGGENKREGDSGTKEQSPLGNTLSDLGATVAGAIFIGFSIAPTEEVPMLATEMQVGNKLALIVLTLFVTYLIVFESGFSPGSGHQQGIFQRPFPETVLSYTVSLMVAAVGLYLFQQIELGREPLDDIVAKILVLGTPAAIGGAAGRALIGGASGGK